MRILNFKDPLAILKNGLRDYREMDSQSQAYSLQEHAAMKRFRSELFEAETAVTRAGATAGRPEAETDVRASELSFEYRQGIE